MAIAVNVTISIDGGPALPDYHSVSIRQELFTHHSFQVAVPYEMLETEHGDGFFHEAHTRYCGKFLTITLTPAVSKDPPLLFKGVITHIALSNSGDFAHSFVLSGFSPTYLLEDGTQRRTFLKKGLKEIFTHVLQPYSQLVPNAGPLAPQHQEAVKYTVQYGESPYAFLRRLADEYGEWFYYDGRALCLGPPADQDALPFAVQGTDGFSMAIELQPTRFALTRYDYLAHKPHEGSSASQSPTQMNPFAAFALQQSDQLFQQPARLQADRHVRSQQQLNTTIKEWQENQVSSLVTFQGTGENPSFGVGRVVAVKGNQGGKPHDYGRYRLTEVTHSVQGDMYQNAFVALPDAAKHPPANPQVQSPPGVPELAEVIDVADPQHLGRVRVRYYWSVEKRADAETGWMRVSTPYSGNGKGQMFTPEVGSQVLVGYEQNQANFPVVLGNLFHPQNPQQAKYTTADNHLKGLQTAGGNKVVMSDKKGEQTILLSNSNNKDTAVEVGFKGDGSITIKSNGPVRVLSPDITLEAGAKGAIKLHAKTISLDAEEELMISSHAKSIALTAKKNITVAAEEKMEVQAKEKTIKTSKKLVIDGGSSVDIKAGKVKVNS
ncbi:phage baseplate assembly protein V [Hymenobacter glaciei]|uniref:Phage baseplate assembly protein V n=1 Tax=Hymenobacter glaciei TaxID=877209 RepID=A0ABP7U7V3_9BACT